MMQSDDEHQELLLCTRVRELLTDPSHWTRGSWARKKDGEYCSVNDPDAVRWCLDGAIMRVNPTVCPNMLYECVSRRGHTYITNFNDSSEHADVLGLLDEAINELKERIDAEG